MKKVLSILLCLLLCTGCTKQKELSHEYSGTYTLEFFYVNDCQNCNYFKTTVVPMIEDEFGDHMVIKMYDMDDDSSNKPYKKIIDQLIDFDDDWYGYAPFASLDGYFAKLGVYVGDGDEFLEDLIKAVNLQPLGSELSEDRYYFQNGKLQDTSLKIENILLIGCIVVMILSGILVIIHQIRRKKYGNTTQ